MAKKSFYINDIKSLRGIIRIAGALVLRPGEFVLFNENTVHSSGPNHTSQPRVGPTPRISVPFVRVTGNPRGAGRDRDRHAPDELREVAMLRGGDYTGRQRVAPLPRGDR